MFYLMSSIIISHLLAISSWLHLERVPCMDLSNDGLKIGLMFMLIGFFNLALYPVVEVMNKREVRS